MKPVKTLVVILLFFAVLITAFPALAQSDRSDIAEINRLSHVWIAYL